MELVEVIAENKMKTIPTSVGDIFFILLSKSR